MDVKKFINLINERKCLWDQNDSNYHLRNYQRNSWKEVAAEMNMPVEDVRKKWRGLRDTFGRELKKSTQTKFGQSADTEFVSKWSYFPILHFLKDTMSRKDSKNNVRAPNYCEDSGSDATFNTNTSIVSESPNSPAPNSNISPTQQNSEFLVNKFRPRRKMYHKKRRSIINDRLSQIEEAKIRSFQENADDSDALFLMSLLPFLNDLPMCRKLIVRAKLQQVLIDEQDTA